MFLLGSFGTYRVPEHQNPTIYLWDLRIDEPITTFTDLILAAVLFYAFWRIHKMENKSQVQTFLKYFFLTMGVATLSVGLMGHGFKYMFNAWWKLPGWWISMISTALIERASIFYSKNLLKPRLGKVFGVVNLIELSTFMILLLFALDFYWVVVHTAYGFLIVVGGFNAYVFARTRSKAAFWMLMGVAATACCAIVYIFEIVIDDWFNHLDLAHIFMTIAAWFTFLGAKVMVKDPGQQIKINGGKG